MINFMTEFCTNNWLRKSEEEMNAVSVAQFYTEEEIHVFSRSDFLIEWLDKFRENNYLAGKLFDNNFYSTQKD
jgi:hypothetical protein